MAGLLPLSGTSRRGLNFCLAVVLLGAYGFGAALSSPGPGSAAGQRAPAAAGLARPRAAGGTGLLGAARSAAVDVCAAPANPIVAENCRPGTTDWQITRTYGDIAGFASTTSAVAGDTIEFYVDSHARQYDLDIYRSGYYGGQGGRLMLSRPGLAGTAQPACRTDPSSGLVSCSNWSVSASLQVPADWVSGVYIVKLKRLDTGGESYMPLVVRDDTRRAAILFQLSVTTYQAYNNFGGKSVYSSLCSSYCTTVTGTPRAVKVSFDRPYALPAPFLNSTYFWVDYPMVSWLESQGYDVSYATDLDTDLSGQAGGLNRLLDHRLFLVVGHDEYWSQDMRQAITAARDAGVSLGFFSSNVSYWRVRFEPDPWTGKAGRVMVTYKTTESGPPDPSGTPTTTWRDPAGANDPENALIGMQYIGDNDNHSFPLRVTAAMGKDRLYRHTGLDTLPEGTYVDLGQRLVGWEWDAVVDNGHTPAGLTVLAASPTFGALLADAGRKYSYGAAMANVTRYQAPSGAIVFAAGTSQWSWGLALVEPNRQLQQMTYNLFADMRVSPATPAATLYLDQAVTAPSPARQQAADSYVTQGVLSRLSDLGVIDTQRSDAPDRLAPGQSQVRSIGAGPAPLVSALRVASTSRAATITWQTDIPANGQVWIKAAPGLSDYGAATWSGWQLPVIASPTHEGLTTAHSFTVDGLEPGTLYYYVIASAGPAGQATFSSEAEFQAPPGSALDRVSSVLRPAYHVGRCWVESNGWPVAGAGAAVMIGAVGLIGFRLWRGGRP